MPEKAVVCTECDRHDSRVFEYGKTFLTIASVIGILFSATVYVYGPVSRVVSAIFIEPKITVESFRTERSARVRNEAGRFIFLTRFQVSIAFEDLPDDPRIPDNQIIRTFDLIEQEIPPGGFVRFETVSLEAERALRLDADGEVTPVVDLEVAQFPYIHEYEDWENGHLGRILFYANLDPELTSRVADETGRNALPAGECTIYFTVEFSSIERAEPFDCRAMAGMIGNSTPALRGYHRWRYARVQNEY